MWLTASGLVEETQLTYHDLFGDSREWQTRVIKPDVQDIIARKQFVDTSSIRDH